MFTPNRRSNLLNHTFIMILQGTVLAYLVLQVAATANSSYCIDYTNFVYVSTGTVVPYDAVTRRYGAVDCLAGDIVLIGKYINLGK
jgi:hypothetical protein